MNPDRQFESGFGKIYSDLKKEFIIYKKKYIEDKKRKKEENKKVGDYEKERADSRSKSVCKLATMYQYYSTTK